MRACPRCGLGVPADDVVPGSPTRCARCWFLWSPPTPEQTVEPVAVGDWGPLADELPGDAPPVSPEYPAVPREYQVLRQPAHRTPWLAIAGLVLVVGSIGVVAVAAFTTAPPPEPSAIRVPAKAPAVVLPRRDESRLSGSPAPSPEFVATGPLVPPESPALPALVAAAIAGGQEALAAPRKPRGRP